MTVAPARPLSALDAIFTRRSVRAFTSQRLDRATVEALLDAAVQAPTALHQEPWVFAVFQDPAALRMLGDLVKTEWLQGAGARPEPNGSVGAGMPMAAELARQLADPGFDVFHGASTLIVIGARSLDRFVVADCWLAAENLMLAACALGLGSCCIGAALPTLGTSSVKSRLGMPDDFQPVAPVVVGVPAGVPGPVSRHEPDIAVWR
jgi:nitroreductase